MAETAPDARLTRDDAMTLIGHAEYLWKVHGEEDMPRFFSGLANRILALLSAPQEPAPEPEGTDANALTRDDAMMLIGHAEYLRKCYGEEDMPRAFDALARRILAVVNTSPAPAALPDIVRAFVERVAQGPCWLRRPDEAECAEAFLPKGQRPASEFCLRCHAKATLAALPEPSRIPCQLPEAVREAAEKLRSVLRTREQRSWCGDLACDAVRHEAEKLLSALDSNGGA